MLFRSKFAKHVPDGIGAVLKDLENAVWTHNATVVARVVFLPMAAIDVAGFVADLKDHAVDHGFHVHDERHFVETYSLRQAWEIELHPDEACGGPVEMHLSLDVDPRTLLAFEDAMATLGDDEEPDDDFHFPLVITWQLPPMAQGPDLLRLTIELAPIGGVSFPLDIAATDTFASATESSERRVTITARVPISLASVIQGTTPVCEVFDRCQSDRKSTRLNSSH